MDCLSDVEKYRLLLEALTYNSQRFQEITFSASGSSLLAIGWILVSDKTRAFLGSRKIVKILSSLVALFVLSAVFTTSLMLYSASSKICIQISELFTECSALPLRYYKHVIINTKATILILIGHTVLNILLILIIWSIKNGEQKESPKVDK